jgi:hypothetical protein
MFYYLGMGKAYLLDQLVQGWREQYLTSTLDALIAAEASHPPVAGDD